MGISKIRGTIVGVPIIRTIVFWGLYWSPLILGHYHIPIIGNVGLTLSGGPKCHVDQRPQACESTP